MGKHEIPTSVLEEIRSGRLAKASAPEILQWGFDRFFPDLIRFTVDERDRLASAA